MSGSSTPRLPESARRLFPHDALEDLTREAIIERLMEEGDRTDLAWLIKTVGESTLAERLRRVGGRRLSARSEAFWNLVLFGSPGEVSRSHDVWLL